MSLLPHIAMVPANAMGLLQPTAKAEAHKTKDDKSKVDGIQTQLIPAAFELNGRWGDGLVLLFKKIVACGSQLATIIYCCKNNDDNCC